MQITSGWTSDKGNPASFTNPKYAIVTKADSTELFLTGHFHCIYGENCEYKADNQPCGHTTVDFATNLTQANFPTNGTLAAGGYVLIGPVTHSGNVVIQGEVNLCLNGYTLDLGASKIIVGDNAKLNICDCNGSGHGQGIIRSNINSNIQYGAVIDVTGENAELHLYSGTVYNSEPTGGLGHALDHQGHGICGQGGKVYIHGGTVHSDNGVALLLTSGTADISGGTIYSNRLYTVCIMDGEANITGGTIYYDGPNNIPHPDPNKPTENLDQYALWIDGGELTVDGENVLITGKDKSTALCVGENAVATIHKGTVSATTKNYYAINNKGTLTIDGPANITAEHYAIFNDFASSNLTISAGKIQGYAGIVNKGTGNLSITGSPEIIGTAQNADIALRIGNYVTPLPDLSCYGGTPYGVYTYDTVSIGSPVRITSKWEESGFSSKTLGLGNEKIPFVSSQGYAIIEMDSDNGTRELFLVLPQVTTTTDGNGTLTVSLADTSVTYPKVGTTITLTATAADGYRIGEATATYKDTAGRVIAVPLTDSGDGKYTFTMPNAELVECHATFVKLHRHYMAVDWEKGHADPNNPDVPGKHADNTPVGDKVTFATELTESYVKALKIYTDQYNEPQYGLESGDYVLIGDITVDKSISIRGDVKLCLNGHNLILGDNSITFNINKDAKLSICDCSEKGSGTITSTEYKSTILFGSGTLNLFRGTIAHPVKDNTENPVVEDGIQILPSTIRCSGTLNMYGGTITSDHHGIYTVSEENAVVNIHGGIINVTAPGAGVYSGTCKSIEIEGETVQITGKTALTAMGGNVTVTAGKLISYTSNSIYIEGGNVTVKENAVVQGKYDAIALMQGTLNLADAPTITSTGGNACILLNYGMVINILDDIGATYSVTTKQAPTAEVPVRITENWKESGSTTTADNSFLLTSKQGYIVRLLEDGELYFVIPTVDIHLWKDHPVTISKEILIDKFFEMDYAGILNRDVYEFRVFEYSSVSNLICSAGTDGYTFTGSVAGEELGTLVMSYTDDNGATTKTMRLGIKAKVFDVKEATYVLDYDKPVVLDKHLFTNDILPGVGENGDTVLLKETFTMEQPVLAENGLSMECGNLGGVGQFGTFSFSEDGSNSYYTPNAMIDGADSAYLVIRAYNNGAEKSDFGTIDPFKEVEMYKKVTILPANVVYYEDSNAALNWNPDGNAGIDIKPVGAPTGDGYQDGDNNSEYGNDSDYAYAPDGTSQGLCRSLRPTDQDRL